MRLNCSSLSVRYKLPRNCWILLLLPCQINLRHRGTEANIVSNKFVSNLKEKRSLTLFCIILFRLLVSLDFQYNSFGFSRTITALSWVVLFCVAPNNILISLALIEFIVLGLLDPFDISRVLPFDLILIWIGLISSASACCSAHCCWWFAAAEIKKNRRKNETTTSTNFRKLSFQIKWISSLAFFSVVFSLFFYLP